MNATTPVDLLAPTVALDNTTLASGSVCAGGTLGFALNYGSAALEGSNYTAADIFMYVEVRGGDSSVSTVARRGLAAAWSQLAHIERRRSSGHSSGGHSSGGHGSSDDGSHAGSGSSDSGSDGSESGSSGSSSSSSGSSSSSSSSSSSKSNGVSAPKSTQTVSVKGRSSPIVIYTPVYYTRYVYPHHIYYTGSTMAAQVTNDTTSSNTTVYDALPVMNLEEFSTNTTNGYLYWNVPVELVGHIYQLRVNLFYASQSNETTDAMAFIVSDVFGVSQCGGASPIWRGSWVLLITWAMILSAVQ
ncbi:hypothetical protein HDU82_005639 [Entophlyctis luteolus]|nr:hypothetical protein HDU82_005639 [Entophlyctis luteolus]